MSLSGALEKRARPAGFGQINALQDIIMPIEYGQTIVSCHGCTYIE
jgi:hypothetical protein